MYSSFNPQIVNEIVVNWHVTEACNFQCQYCFAKWSDRKKATDLIKCPTDTDQLISAIRHFFAEDRRHNPLWEGLHWKDVRLNIAGGEPLLYSRQVNHALKQAKNSGLNTSIITNASYLTDQAVIHELASSVDWLGISIDSTDPSINRKIGRSDRRGRLLDLEHLANLLDSVRHAHPSMKLKINTVISSENHAMDFSPVLDRLQPDKWKVFRVLPVVTDALTIGRTQFQNFAARHARYASIAKFEDHYDMLESYIMLDPKGRFYQNVNNESGSGYQYSRPVLDVGIVRAFEEISVSATRFASRY